MCWTVSQFPVSFPERHLHYYHHEKWQYQPIISSDCCLTADQVRDPYAVAQHKLFNIFSESCLEITSRHLTSDGVWRQALTTVANCTPFLKCFPALLDLVKLPGQGWKQTNKPYCNHTTTKSLEFTRFIHNLLNLYSIGKTQESWQKFLVPISITNITSLSQYSHEFLLQKLYCA